MGSSFLLCNGYPNGGRLLRPPPVIIIIRKFAAVNPVKEDGKIVSLALLGCNAGLFCRVSGTRVIRLTRR